MTLYYYGLDVEVDNYIGCGVYNETVKRTLKVIKQISKNKVQDSFTEIDFETNKEQLAADAIANYNKIHKAKASRIIGIRRTPIIDFKEDLETNK